MKEIIEFDEFHWHEVVDRTNLLTETWYDQIEEHIVVEANPELKSMAEEITSMMYQFYCLAAIYAEPELLKEESKLRITKYEYDDKDTE